METSVPDPITASPSAWSGQPVRESNSFVGWRVLWPNKRALLLPRTGQGRARCQGSRHSDKGRHAKVLCQWSRIENLSSLRVLQGPEFTFLSYHLASGALLLTCSTGRAPAFPPSLLSSLPPSQGCCQRISGVCEQACRVSSLTAVASAVAPVK